MWPLLCAVAQSTLPSQVVPGTLRPPTTDASAPTELRPRPSSDLTDAAPQGPRVRLDRIDVVGGFAALSGAAQTVAQTLHGRAVSMIDIQRAATELERAYNDAGYVLARVIVPPQQLVDGGSLSLRVIDGFIEEVVVDAVPEPLRAPVRERLLRLVRQTQLTSAQLEREVLLAGELPGLRLRSALVRGTQDGGTRLVVESGFIPMALQVQLDNGLSDALGRTQLSTTLALNSPLGRGEQWYAALTYAPSQGVGRPAALRTLGAGLVLPLGTRGTTLNAEYTHSSTAPQDAPGTLATIGEFERLSARFTQALLRDRNGRLDLRAALEHISQTLTASAFAVDLNRDRYRAMRLGLEGAFAVPQCAAVRAEASLDAGLGGRDAASSAASGLPTSRQGASAHFTKATFGVDLQHASAGAWRLDWRTRGQLAGRPLFTPESLALVGPDTLSAFDPGSLSADQGLVTRLQIGHALNVGAPDGNTGLLAYGFVAAAHGHVFEATAVQAATIEAAAAGIGLRLEHSADRGRSLSFALEAANGRSNQPTQRRPARVGLSVALRL
ncbi:MAG: ShlB/FhaC/HecB family hemolysin secretion/activation protein [Burkholderiales bacterium]